MNSGASSSGYSESVGDMENYDLAEDREQEPAEEVQIWLPALVKGVLDTDELLVSTLDMVDLKQVDDDIKYSQGFGLRIVSDMKCSPDGKAHLLLCITTIRNIYVMRPEVSSDIDFLRRQLTRNDIDPRRVFVWEGTKVGYYLDKHFNIRLDEQTDLQSFDLNLTLEQHIDEHPNQISFLKGPYVDSVIQPRRKTFNSLVYEWIRIHPELLQTYIVEHREIGLFPLTIRAQNVIKKRCALVRHLGLTMMRYFEDRRRIPLNLIYSLAHKSDADAEAFRASNQEYMDLRNSC